MADFPKPNNLFKFNNELIPKIRLPVTKYIVSLFANVYPKSKQFKFDTRFRCSRLRLKCVHQEDLCSELGDVTIFSHSHNRTTRSLPRGKFRHPLSIAIGQLSGSHTCHRTLQSAAPDNTSPCRVSCALQPRSRVSCVVSSVSRVTAPAGSAVPRTSVM